MSHADCLEEDKFSCNSCQAKGKDRAHPIQPERTTTHLYTHPLVRCGEHHQNPKLTAAPTTADLREMIRKLEDNVDLIKGHIKGLEERFNDRLSGMEKCLEGLERRMVQLTESANGLGKYGE